MEPGCSDIPLMLERSRVVPRLRPSPAIRRDQLTASTRFKATVWGWSEAGVRRFIERLKTDALIDAAETASAHDQENSTRFRRLIIRQRDVPTPRLRLAVKIAAWLPAVTREILSAHRGGSHAHGARNRTRPTSYRSRRNRRSHRYRQGTQGHGGGRRWFDQAPATGGAWRVLLACSRRQRNSIRCQLR